MASSTRLEPLGVERVVGARTGVMAFHGRADRIDGPPAAGDRGLQDRPVRPGAEEARGSAALALYAYAAERVFHRPCRRVELHHLPTGTVAGADHTDESLGRHLRRAEQTAADIQEAGGPAGADPDEQFPARAGPHCGWCDYRRACPAGKDVPGKDPWAAVPD